MKQLIALSSAVSLVFYGMFILFDRPVHWKIGPIPSDDLINPWLRGRVFKDGIEVPVMLLGSIIYVGVLFVLFRKIKLSSRAPLSGAWRSQSGLLRYARNDMVVIGLLVLFSVFVLLSLDHPILWDYNFFVAPAWKMLQGQALQTFSMRYSLLMTSLFAFMLQLKFQLPQMQLVIAVSFIIWFFLYYFLASRMISDRKLVLLFAVALIVIRYLSVLRDPTVLPQNAPLRLDLWVLPFLVALRFGIASLPTSIAFSAAYVLDNNFGLFGLLSYVSVLIWMRLSSRAPLSGAWRSQSGLLRYARNDILFAPVGIALLLQLLLFGSFTSFASQEFVSAQVDFIPTGRTSLFWLIFAALPYYVFIVSAEKERRAKSLLLLLLALALTHLTYFYGRSHDNSLLNISGLFVLMFFVALDRFGSIKSRAAYGIAVALIACSIVFFWRDIESKFTLAINTIRTGQIIKSHPIDEHIEAIRPTIAAYKQKNDKLFFLSIFDGYYHYRLGVPQPGFYTPLFGSVYLKDVIDPLTSYLKNGYTVLFFEPHVEQLIPEFGRFDYRVEKEIGELFLER